MAEEESGKELERIYVVPLRRAKIGRSSRAAPRAIKEVRGFLTKHMKVDEDDIWIDDSLNRELWSKGKYKVPSKIRVRAVKFEDGVVEVTPPELGVKKSMREILKEEKERKIPVLRKKEKEEVPEEGVPGAEEYEISPAAEGEVKIKKKKAPREKKEVKEEKETKKKESAEEKPEGEKKAGSEKED